MTLLLYQWWNFSNGDKTVTAKWQRSGDRGGVTCEGSKREGIRLALVDIPWIDRTVSWFPTSTSPSEPCCKGTDSLWSATNSQAHHLYGQQVNTEHLPYHETEHGRSKHPCPRKQRQPEVCLTEQKLFKLLGPPALGKA